MEVYTPAFIKIRELLQVELLKYIGENIVVNSNDINEFIMVLKDRSKHENKNFDLIDFTYSYPFSSQVQNLLVDLVRRCIVRQTRDGYQLTSHGLSLIGNDI